jgi:hypothetical protein
MPGANFPIFGKTRPANALLRRDIMTNEQNKQDQNLKPGAAQENKQAAGNPPQQEQGQPSKGAEKPVQQNQGDAAKKQQS